ncbi:putative F-box protein At1g47300 [Quercus suber]|uniref:putative F-box protein At1g47300 n=1 Tax=Quercus suber TaxID=58331 RepID=UPI0032DECB05
MMNLLRDSKGSDEESKENQSLPKDMMYDIMLRLPGKSIFRFKCVSKTFNTSMLSDSLFIHNYFTRKLQQKQLKNPTLLGFFYKVHNPQNLNHCVDQCCKDQEVSFVPMCHQGVPIASRSFKQGLGNFIASANGLVLYGHHPMTYYVCNPVTNIWFALPPPIHTDDYHTEVRHNMYASDDTIKNLVGFYCQEEDEQLSHHDIDVDAITNHRRQSYKVVRFFVKQAINNDWEMVVKIYSSDTGIWKESKLDYFGMPLYHVLAMSSYSISIRGVFFCSTTISTGMLIFAYVFNMGRDGLDELIEGPSSSHINGRAYGAIGESHLGFFNVL